MKKILITVCSVFMALGLNLTAYAAEEDFALRAREIEDVAHFVDENTARVTGTARGMLLSTVEVSVEDLGGGTVEIFSDVLCHEEMEKIKLNLLLDKWNSETEKWSQIKKFEYTWLAEDEPDQHLTMAHVYVEVPGLERGVNYRARAIVGAWDLDSDYYEVWNAKTDSILVE